jgi:hypothetical protein
MYPEECSGNKGNVNIPGSHEDYVKDKEGVKYV